MGGLYNNRLLLSKSLQLVFQTVDPAFFLLPFVIHKQGILVSLFFFIELNVFAFLAGKALIEVRALHQQCASSLEQESKFVLIDIIDYYCPSKILKGYFKTVVYLFLVMQVASVLSFSALSLGPVLTHTPANEITLLKYIIVVLILFTIVGFNKVCTVVKWLKLSSFIR